MTTFQSLKKPARYSYLFVFLLLVVAAWLRLGLPLVAVLLSYFALEKLHYINNK